LIHRSWLYDDRLVNEEEKCGKQYYKFDKDYIVIEYVLQIDRYNYMFLYTTDT